MKFLLQSTFTLCCVVLLESVVYMLMRENVLTSVGHSDASRLVEAIKEFDKTIRLVDIDNSNCL